MTNISCQECGGLGWLWNGCAKVKCPCTAKPKPKRSRLRKQSRKKRRELAEEKHLKQIAREKIKRCEICDERPWTDPHHVPGGSSRQRAVGHFRRVLWVCRRCHDKAEAMSIAEQIELFNAATKRSVYAALYETEEK